MARCQISTRMIFMVDYSHITDLGNAVLTKIYMQPGDESNFDDITGFHWRECIELQQ